MSAFCIEPSKSTPSVRFSPEDHMLEIKGESYPENAASFYQRILERLRKWLNSSDSMKLEVRFELLYYNSSSSKAIMNLMDIIEEAVINGWDINVAWIFDEENEIIRESGEEFKEDYDSIAIRLIALPSEK